MKKIWIFKALVDMLYVLHFLGFVAILLLLPFESIKINHVSNPISDWSIFYQFVIVVSLFAYALILRGLYFLKKTTHFLLSKERFSPCITANLRRSGNYFLYAAIVSATTTIAIWLQKITQGKLELNYDPNLFISMFLAIVGLFFIIQSKSLQFAKELEVENELTI